MNSEDKVLQEQQKKIYAQKLNYYMALNHKQQDDIVNDLGINKSSISTWCRGVKMPRVNAIQALADYFNISISDLIEEKKEVYSATTTYKKSKIFKKPKIVVYVDGPFYVDNFLTKKEKSNTLAKIVRDKMIERSKMSNVEYVIYKKKDN